MTVTSGPYIWLMRLSIHEPYERQIQQLEGQMTDALAILDWDGEDAASSSR